MTAEDTRLPALKNWLNTLFNYKMDIESLRPASSDASFRRYFRLDAGANSYIVMDAPPQKENVLPFIQVAELFGQSGVAVPKVIEKNTTEGFLLLTDLGSTTYLQKLKEDETQAHTLYMDALHALIRIQAFSQPGILPDYDRTRLLNEMQLFPEWYIKKHLKYALSDEQQKALSTIFDRILAYNLAEPCVYVHRDCHSRNLMVLPQGGPGILDFQDAVFGPITYDLVSLLRDAYIVWDEERVLDWVIRYWEDARKVGLPVNPNIDQFYRDFEFMGLQRHIKVLGIFARLYYRDGKDAYLNDLPVVEQYVYKTASRYPELSSLVKLMDTLLQKEQQVGYTF